MKPAKEDSDSVEDLNGSSEEKNDEKLKTEETSDVNDVFIYLLQSLVSTFLFFFQVPIWFSQSIQAYEYCQ
jgi:hypothetical protein